MISGIMKVWQILCTIIEAILLNEVLLGKRVTKLDGTMLGTAADINLDLMQGTIWVILEYQGQWRRISTKQISSLTNKEIVFKTSTAVYPVKEIETLPQLL